MAIKAIKDKQTKAQIVSDIADATDMTKKDVKAVLEALADQAKSHLVKRGSGEFTIPEMGVKLRRKEQPARKARKGVNPFTGEEMMIKAKPKSMTVRATVLKAMKDSIQ
ncbi:MAG: HU family DNA-binding protein [Gammaproteobacteria bacterium]|nr:HU family DNA-binding protein [Gammaproteobacteria bacterium]